MPVEFMQYPPLENTGSSSDTARLSMMYDGSGRRISKTAMRMVGDDDWDTTLVTHYTGIGTEIREYKPRNFVRYTDSAGVEHCVSANPDYGGNASTACPLPDTVKVAVPLPQGLGRYALQDADHQAEEGAPQAFEWYLKNHLGSTMVVYGTGFPDPLGISPEGELRAAYDYRSFGEQLDLLVFTRKVTENFTGKEKDDETQLDYFGARYLDPMLGMWISVDPARQFASPYLYAGNGMNPVNVVDPDGNAPYQIAIFVDNPDMLKAKPNEGLGDDFRDFYATAKWGRKKFGNDFAIKAIQNQEEMLNFVKEGQYTAIIAHTFLDENNKPEQGTLVNRLNDPEEIYLYILDLDLQETDSYAKVFGCHVGRWKDTYDNIDLGSNKGPLPMGDAYQDAADYLMEKKPNDNK